MKSQRAEDRNGVCAVSFRHDNQWRSGVVDHSDVIEHVVIGSMRQKQDGAGI